METYEEKYKEALRKAKDMLSYKEVRQEDMEYLFPELKESEDEKIRKHIYNYINVTLDDNESAEKEKWLAWLEKQGEQPQGKSAQAVKEEKIESKFKIGDWITDIGIAVNNQETVFQVIEIKCGIYVIRDNIINHVFHIGIDECERNGRLWELSDAKDGDVLAFKNNIGGIIIVKSSTSYDTKSYCRLISDNFINKEESGWDSTLLVPATKEQRDTLFKAMADDGYTFDFDKKELNRIKQ